MLVYQIIISTILLLMQMYRDKRQAVWDLQQRRSISKFFGYFGESKWIYILNICFQRFNFGRIYTLLGAGLLIPFILEHAMLVCNRGIGGIPSSR